LKIDFDAEAVFEHFTSTEISDTVVHEVLFTKVLVYPGASTAKIRKNL
jgi:hypothetical protein